ncbi:hypothetical protein MKX01_033138 [Papaver californicum]|nr:hypothetical protein MKX01_033138 [Papaver californicum]
MAKTASLCLAPLFVGLIFISIVLMMTPIFFVNGMETGCAEFNMGFKPLAELSCGRVCDDNFHGATNLRHEVHDYLSFSMKCTCCFED